eukprot:5354275-Amphidinium_carterae.1
MNRKTCHTWQQCCGPLSCQTSSLKQCPQYLAWFVLGCTPSSGGKPVSMLHCTGVELWAFRLLGHGPALLQPQ